MYLAEEAVWRRTLWYYQHHSVMKSMKVSSPPGRCDLCQPPMPAKGNTGGCLHNGWGFVGVLKWHSSVGLGEHRMGNSSWMTRCYSLPWHGLCSTSTLLAIAASFSDLWLNFPPLFFFLHLLSSLFLLLPLLHLHFCCISPPPQAPSRRWSTISGGWFGRRTASALSWSTSWWKWAG